MSSILTITQRKFNKKWSLMTSVIVNPDNYHIDRADSRLTFIKIKIMISVTSVTDKYIIQPALLSKHRKSLEWLSAAVLWKRELSFFQNLLDQYSPKLTSVED